MAKTSDNPEEQHKHNAEANRKEKPELEGQKDTFDNPGSESEVKEKDLKNLKQKFRRESKEIGENENRKSYSDNNGSTNEFGAKEKDIPDNDSSNELETDKKYAHDEVTGGLESEKNRISRVDTTENTNEDTTKNTNEDITENTNEDITENTNEDTTKNTNQDITENTKKEEYLRKIKRSSKIFSIAVLVLAIFSVVLVYFAELEIEDEIGLLGYNMSILRGFRFLWIILFTVYLSKLVPIGMILVLERFIDQIRDVSDKENGEDSGTAVSEKKTLDQPQNEDVSENSEDVESAEKFIGNFFKFTILIVGFAYGFLALGIDLNSEVDIIGSTITVSNLLNAVLTGLIAGVFIVYFLPLILNIFISTSLKLYKSRHKTQDELVKGMKNELEKIKPGLRKLLVYMIALIAALAIIGHLEEESDDDSNGNSSSDPYSEFSSATEDISDFQEVLNLLEVILKCILILVFALFLTTLTPLIVYSLSTSPENIRESNLYKAGKYLNYVILIIAFFLILNVIGMDLDASVNMGENKITLWSIISAIIVLIVTQMVSKLIIAMLEDTVLNPDQMDEHASKVMGKLIYYIIVFFGIAVAMSTLGINLFAIVTGLGLLAFAIAFGMQNTIANFMAGIMIAIERPFRIGDRIRVGSEWGDVLDIGMRSTTIRTVKNETVVIPNNLVATREVWNFTKDSPIIANVIPIGISYDSDAEFARKIIRKEAEKNSEVIDDPPVHVRMIGYGNSSIDLELWAWIADARRKERIKSDLLFRIKKQFDKQGIEIPFPHRTLVFKDKGGGKKKVNELLKD